MSVPKFWKIGTFTFKMIIFNKNNFYQETFQIRSMAKKISLIVKLMGKILKKHFWTKKKGKSYERKHK